jgi:hypothetical protein
MLPAIGLGFLAVGAAVVLWAALQNWLANTLERLDPGPVPYALQSALVILDRVMVNGQRVFTATLKVVLRGMGIQQSKTVEETRQILAEDLPADVRERLERGQVLEYELAVGTMRPLEKKDVTYRLVVQRAE